MIYNATSQPSAYCPECDEPISADIYSPFHDMCEKCENDRDEDEANEVL